MGVNVMAVKITPESQLSKNKPVQPSRQKHLGTRIREGLALLIARSKAGKKAKRMSACRAAHGPWELSPAGEEAMERVLDPHSGAGRPTEPSMAAAQVDLGTIRRIRAQRTKTA
jgi:hypothetical protein